MKVVIYGTGKMAELIWYCFTHDSPYQVVAFCVDDEYKSTHEDYLFNLPVLNFDQVLDQFPPHSNQIHVGVGRNSAREAIYHKVSKAGYSFANYISSRANVWPDLVYGKNIFLDQDTNIHPFVKIGNNCMLIGVRIGHHCTIEDNVLLSCATLAGNVHIGAGSFLGINSAIKEDVVIGQCNIIGASVFINKSTEDFSIISNSSNPQRIGDSKRFVMFHKHSEIKQA